MQLARATGAIFMLRAILPPPHATFARVNAIFCILNATFKNSTFFDYQ